MSEGDAEHGVRSRRVGVLRRRAGRPRLAAVLQQFDGLVLRRHGRALQVRYIEFCTGLFEGQRNLHCLKEVEYLLVQYFEKRHLDGVLAGVFALLNVPEDVSDNLWDDAACVVVSLGM